MINMQFLHILIVNLVPNNDLLLLHWSNRAPVQEMFGGGLRYLSHCSLLLRCDLCPADIYKSVSVNLLNTGKVTFPTKSGQITDNSLWKFLISTKPAAHFCTTPPIITTRHLQIQLLKYFRNCITSLECEPIQHLMTERSLSMCFPLQVMKILFTIHSTLLPDQATGVCIVYIS